MARLAQLFRSASFVRRAVAGTAVVGTGLAASQGRDLLREWRSRHAGLLSPCKGPTDGIEQGRPAGADSRRRRGAGTAPGAAEAGRRPTLVLFLGDSLVCGVGGQAGSAPLPAALPQAVAARLSDLKGSAVRWASVGIVGAGVDRLVAEGLPLLRGKIASCHDTTHVVVVVVVGVNDLKQMNFAGYRLGLRRLVAEVRVLVSELRDVARRGQVVDVFVPELKIADAPLLQRFPLRFFARPVCALWEREKRQAVGPDNQAEVLAFPQPPEGVDVATLFSKDEMHPSLSGYEWWADNLARQIHSRLGARVAWGPLAGQPRSEA